MTRKKKSHGGARKGAGRPPGEETVRVSVPVSKLSKVLAIVNDVPPIDQTADDVRQELKEIAAYFGGWPELKTIVDELEAADKVTRAERYYADGQ